MNTDKSSSIERRYCFNPVKSRTWVIECLDKINVEVFSLKTETSTDIKDDLEIVGFAASDFHFIKASHDLALYNWRSNFALILSGYFRKCLPFIRSARFLCNGQVESLNSVDIERNLTKTAALKRFMPEYFKIVDLELSEIESMARES